METAIVGTVEPGVRLAPRVSWGALLAGTLVTFAVAMLLGMLGCAITFLVTDATHLVGTLIALFLIAIGITLVGAAVGGFFSGRLCGSGLTRLGAVHGFCAGALAFLVATFCSSLLVGGAVRAVGNTAIVTSQAVTTMAPGGPLGRGPSNAERFLEGLGFSTDESRAMIHDLQQSIQGIVRGPSEAGAATPDATAVATSAIHFLGGATWIYFGTWLLAILISLGFGALGTRRALGLPVGARRIVTEPTPPPLVTPPLQPKGV